MREMEQHKTFKWNDAHFCSLASQTNIYGLQKLRTEKDTSKLLVSCLDRSFFSVEYHKTAGDKLTPITKDIQFTYIPGGAEIVSTDVFERLPPHSGLVVGITFIKPQEHETLPVSQVLNIYSAIPLSEESGEETSGDERKLETVADCSQNLNLDFRPFLLTHTEIIVEGKKQLVFLLSGSDCRVHMYRELPGERFREEPCDQHFPEFSEISSSILQLVIRKVSASQRLTAIGQQDGVVRVFQVDCHRQELLKEWKAETDSPVTSLNFFTQYNIIPCPAALENGLEDGSQIPHADEDLPRNDINLLMTSALEQAVVYRNVLSNGLSEVLWLPESDRYDIDLCSLPADIDFDGQNEILIGTYGQELLVYKFFPTRDKWLPVEPPVVDLVDTANDPLSSDDPAAHLARQKEEMTGKHRHKSDETEESGKHRHKSDESSASERSQPQRKVKSEEDLSLLADLQTEHDKEEPKEKKESKMELRTVSEPHYKLLWQRSFPCPVMRLDCADMMGDGLDNLIVLTLHGLHIMQPDLGEVSALLTSRLQQLCMSESDMGDEFHKLQTELS